MKYERTAAFKADYKGLPASHQEKFRQAAVRFARAAEAATSGDDNPWPNGLRVKRVKGTRDVWEMTFSMHQPDGRATWQWTKIDGETGVLWRRIGTHSVLSDP